MDSKEKIAKFITTENNRQIALLTGRAGCGKSQYAAQIAEHLDMGFKVINMNDTLPGELFPSYIDRENAFRTHIDRRLKFTQEDLEETPNGVLVLLDEVTRSLAKNEVMNILQSRVIKGTTLNPNIYLIAAANIGPEFDAEDLDIAQRRRFQPFDAEPTVSEWVAYESTKPWYNEIVCAFVEEQNLLFSSKEFEAQNFQVLCPATWEQLMILGDEYAENTLGREVGTEYLAFCKQARLPDPEHLTGEIPKHLMRSYALSWLRPEKNLSDTGIKTLFEHLSEDVKLTLLASLHGVNDALYMKLMNIL